MLLTWEVRAFGNRWAVLIVSKLGSTLDIWWTGARSANLPQRLGKSHITKNCPVQNASRAPTKKHQNAERRAETCIPKAEYLH